MNNETHGIKCLLYLLKDLISIYEPSQLDLRSYTVEVVVEEASRKFKLSQAFDLRNKKKGHKVYKRKAVKIINPV